MQREGVRNLLGLKNKTKHGTNNEAIWSDYVYVKHPSLYENQLVLSVGQFSKC